MRAFFDSKIQDCPDIWTLYFRTDTKLEYEAGQFVEMILPEMPASELNRRWFTLSSSPTESRIAITSRFSRSDSTYKQELFNLQHDDSVEITDTLGDFILPMDSSRQLVFVAAGIGITPFRSMLKYLDDKKDTRTIVLIHAARNVEDLCFSDYIKKLDFIDYQPLISSNNGFENSKKNTLSPELIIVSAPASENMLYYLAGPEDYMRELTLGLIELGVEKSDIVTDYFSGYK